MADDGVSVILSSHMLAELERVADYLVLLSGGRMRLSGPVDDLLSEHRVVTSAATEILDGDDWAVVETSNAGGQTHRVVRLVDPGVWKAPSGSVVRGVGIEELSLAYLRQSPASLALAQTGASA